MVIGRVSGFKLDLNPLACPEVFAAGRVNELHAGIGGHIITMGEGEACADTVKSRDAVVPVKHYLYSIILVRKEIRGDSDLYVPMPFPMRRSFIEECVPGRSLMIKIQ
jgi:hypothetical protein